MCADNADESVQGTYSCVAVSTAGSSSATTTLAVFGESNFVLRHVFGFNIDFVPCNSHRQCRKSISQKCGPGQLRWELLLLRSREN